MERSVAIYYSIHNNAIHVFRIINRNSHFYLHFNRTVNMQLFFLISHEVF